MNVTVRISTNVTANAVSVLNDTADLFDWSDVVPGSLPGQIHNRARERFANVDLGGRLTTSS